MRLHVAHFLFNVQVLAQQQLVLLLLALVVIHHSQILREILYFAVVLPPLNQQTLRGGGLRLAVHSLVQLGRVKVVVENLQVVEILNFEHEFFN